MENCRACLPPPTTTTTRHVGGKVVSIDPPNFLPVLLAVVPAGSEPNGALGHAASLTILIMTGCRKDHLIPVVERPHVESEVLAWGQVLHDFVTTRLNIQKNRRIVPNRDRVLRNEIPPRRRTTGRKQPNQKNSAHETKKPSCIHGSPLKQVRIKVFSQQKLQASLVFSAPNSSK